MVSTGKTKFAAWNALLATKDFTLTSILAVDVGTKRVGLALCDEAGRPIIRPTSVARARGIAENKILELIGKHAVETLVAGLPLDESGLRTPQCEDIEKFCRRLVRRCHAKLQYVDEYLSSVEAQVRNADVDAGAADLILKDFLKGVGLT